MSGPIGQSEDGLCSHVLNGDNDRVEIFHEYENYQGFLRFMGLPPLLFPKGM
jgi:hypothetical protein